MRKDNYVMNVKGMMSCAAGPAGNSMIIIGIYCPYGNGDDSKRA
jgi:hypothetical protein